MENATCSLPLIVAMGGIHRVTVVTSRWHLRAPYFFAPYRDLGLELSFRYVNLHGPWLRMIRRELLGLRGARSQRRRAYADMCLPPPAAAATVGAPAGPSPPTRGTNAA